MTYRMTNEAMREAIARAVGKDGDYTADLNAMHEAEKHLHGEELISYSDYLLVGLRGKVDSWFACAHATAAQRAEAFCRTVPCGCGCGLTIWECSESKAKEVAK